MPSRVGWKKVVNTNAATPFHARAVGVGGGGDESTGLAYA